MSLYRGAGGASDATDDSTVNAVAGYAASAATSATNAAASATTASNASTAASTAASAANTSSSTAATSATNAATSATSAATSASTATTQASNASTSATNAANSASTASTAANTAASSNTSASTNATAAASSATAAASSAASALAYKNSTVAIYGSTVAVQSAVDGSYANSSLAQTSATLAGTRATAAAESATAAYDYATVASGWATSAQNSANTAQAFSTSATNSANTATSQADISTTKAAEAAASAVAAANSASSASTVLGSGNGIFGATPISTSSTVTLSGGTANGVAYLNGSKVLTTGTALTFDGSKLGVGTSTLNGSVTVKNPSVTGNQVIFAIQAGTSTSQLASWDLNQTTDVSTFGTDYGAPLAFKINSAEQMRLTSTGLGVGTSSPSGKIHSQVATPSTAGIASIYYGGDGTKRFQLLQTGATYNTAGAGGNELWYYTASYAALTFGSDGNIPIKWVSNGSEQMRLTSTGLGIGTSSPSQKLVVSNGGAEGLEISPNAIASGPALISYNRSGAGYTPLTAAALRHVWQNSGTEAMRLDSTGLGIGTSSPAAKLNVVGADAAIVGLIAGATNGIRIIPKASSAEVAATDKTGSASYQQLDLNGSLLTFLTSGTERMRLDSSGNLGLGVTPSAWGGNAKGIQITNYGSVSGNSSIGTASLAANAYEYADNGWKRTNATSAGLYQISYTGAHTWSQAGAATANSIITFTQAMTLTAAGDLLLGTTTNTLGGGSRVIAQTSNAFYTYTSNQTGTGTKYHFQFADSGTACGTITSSGSVTSYNTSSDQRLKENIVDAPEFGSVIDSIQVRSFDWKSDGSHQRYGFIAQELVTVAPEAVHQPANEEDMMAVDYSKLVPMLVKEIQSLRQRLSTLESK